MNEKHRAKKSLGQHFLRSKTALREIIAASNIKNEETILEIGPGEGALTRALLDAGAHVIAVETDQRCILLLHEKFAHELTQKALQLIEGDIRDSATQELLYKKEYLGSKPYKIVANIPYYITGMLFKLFLEILRQPTHIVFLVQKEVAEQIIARDGKESIFSLAVKVYGTPRYVAKVKREAFAPPPKVDSAVIAIEHISREQLKDIKEEKYFRIIKAGLGAKRKMLMGNLLRTLPLEKTTLSKIFHQLDIPEHVRGEDVPVEKWIALAKAIATQI